MRGVNPRIRPSSVRIREDVAAAAIAGLSGYRSTRHNLAGAPAYAVCRQLWGRQKEIIVKLPGDWGNQMSSITKEIAGEPGERTPSALGMLLLSSLRPILASLLLAFIILATELTKHSLLDIVPHDLRDKVLALVVVILTFQFYDFLLRFHPFQIQASEYFGQSEKREQRLLEALEKLSANLKAETRSTLTALNNIENCFLPNERIYRVLNKLGSAPKQDMDNKLWWDIAEKTMNAELDRIGEIVSEIGNQRLALPKEDSEIISELTLKLRDNSIFATSCNWIDGIEFWSHRGKRYLQEQAQSIMAGNKIERIFVFDFDFRKGLSQEWKETLRMNINAGVTVQAITKKEAGLHAVDFVLFGEKDKNPIVYQFEKGDGTASHPSQTVISRAEADVDSKRDAFKTLKSQAMPIVLADLDTLPTATSSN
jgi:hypothetical protein